MFLGYFVIKNRGKGGVGILQWCARANSKNKPSKITASFQIKASEFDGWKTTTISNFTKAFSNMMKVKIIIYG